ncbi:MAG: hypothetical protein ABIO70_15995 [Pseudomonadota bacterium]
MNTDPGKLSTVRSEVRSLLERSATFRDLPADRRRQIAQDLVKVGAFLADPSWLGRPAAPEAGAQAEQVLHALRTEVLANTPGGPPLAQAAAASDDVQARLAEAPGQVGQDFKAGAVREGVDAFQKMVQAVDFPKFVSGLVQGVFQAIVDASIQQMEAYGELMAAVSKSVGQFAEDHISDAQARDFIANRNPRQVVVVNTPEGARLQANPAAEDTSGLGQQFGLTRSVDIEDPAGEQQLVLAAKMEMARSRQQLMATMVLLGINRIVVTNGRINAKVVFDMRASDEASRSARASMYDDQRSQDQSAAGAWAPWGAAGASHTKSHVTTVKSSVDDDSESKASVKAQLSGDVRINFKSETFPLERIADAGGLAMLNAKAQPGSAPAPARAVPAPLPAPVPAAPPRTTAPANTPTPQV